MMMTECDKSSIDSYLHSHQQTCRSPLPLESVAEHSPTPSYFRSQIFTAHSGINPLTTAASALLALIPRLAVIQSHTQSEQLYHQLRHELDAFTSAAEKHRYSTRLIFLARYILSGFIDEVLSFSPWGQQGAWTNKRLICHYLQDDISLEQAGEQVFSIIKRLCQDATKYIDLLELSFVCLTLGLQGPHRHTAHSHNEHQDMINHVYTLICQQRRSLTKPITHATSYTPPAKRRYSLTVLMISLLLVVGCYTGSNALFKLSSLPIQQQLKKIKQTHLHIKHEYIKHV